MGRRTAPTTDSTARSAGAHSSEAPEAATELSMALSARAADEGDEADSLLQALTPAQRKRVGAAAERAAARASGPPMKLSFDGTTLQITYVHPDAAAAAALLMADLGTADPAFFDGITAQIASIGTQGRRIDERSSNFLLSVVRAVEPRDELEAMLAVQMGAIHSATLMMARRLNHVETLPQQDAAERALNKLARTYAGQMEALKRYRSKGTQVVRVERVTVESGGQAVVGNVETGALDRGVGSP